MRRREFIALLSGVATGWPLVGPTEQPTTPVIGFLTTSKPYPPLINEFRSGLAETGYYEGHNVVIDYAWAEGHYDRLPSLAAELVRRRVDVIAAAGGTNAGTAAKAATSTIPIVVLIGGDPVELGLAVSVSRPGGNVTGIAQLVVATEQKRLELLHELADCQNNSLSPEPSRSERREAGPGRSLARAYAPFPSQLEEERARSGLKKLRSSLANASGCSIAAKCPP
jgi:ABC transporter substrate binding protein